MKLFVSSYTAASALEPWDRAAEEALFSGFSELGLAGLELPFTGRLHRHDEDWLIGRIRPGWRLVLTLVPGTMERLKADRHFGLASTDPGGRARAIEFAGLARDAVERLARRLGRAAVAAVDVHSAPGLVGTGAGSSSEAFCDSLTTLRGMDWGGAELLVEHCDAAVRGQPAEKGFLGLEDECRAVRLSTGPTRARMLVNWARSAIETRSADGPLEHISLVKRSGLLGGLFFSGCTQEHPEYGAWKDTHAPFSASCPGSLLTRAAARACLKEAGDVDYLGVKIQVLPASQGTAERLATIRTALGEVSAAAAC